VLQSVASFALQVFSFLPRQVLVGFFVLAGALTGWSLKVMEAAQVMDAAPAHRHVGCVVGSRRRVLSQGSYRLGWVTGFGVLGLFRSC
jgi:hypothetical protein